LFTREQLVAQFTLEGISGGNAVFNQEKLDWMNAQHVARLTPDAIVAAIRPELDARGLWSPAFETSRRAWLQQAIDLVKPRVKRSADFVAQLEPYLRDRVSYDPAAVDRHLGTDGLADHVAALADAFERVDGFDAASTEAALRRVADARGVKAGALIHATRVALTGQAVSPGLFDVVAIVGQAGTVRRLRELERFLRQRSMSARQ
jgi:glutamyl-tRNA synthetase